VSIEHGAPQQMMQPASRARLAIGIIGVLVVLLLLGLTGGAAYARSGVELVALVPAAFLAGVVSFLSPCTLPILPAYFAFAVRTHQKNVVVMTVAFFFGLATTMSLLGATATALSGFLNQNRDALATIGGLIIMAFGLLTLFGVGFSGFQIQAGRSATAMGSYLYGLTFALGWTSCLGPILGIVLTLLATQSLAIWQGAALAFVYAFGLGLPLIVVAALFSRVGNGSPVWKVLRGRSVPLTLGSRTLYFHSTSVISGLLFLLVGYLLASGQLFQITTEALGSDLSRWVIETEERLSGLFGVR
jgi:cytochrome c-type biogenesis protein